MTICFAASFSIAQVVEVEERLPDGSVLVTIDGVRYRALPAELLRKVVETRVELDACDTELDIVRERSETLQKAFDTSRRDAALAAEQIGFERRRGDEYKRLFEAERELRLAAERLPGKKNVFEKIFGNRFLQMAIVGTAAVVAAKNSQ